MKFKTFLVVALTTLAFSLSAETAYQKKTYQIYEKYFTLFKDGYSHGLTAGEAIVFSMNPEAMTAAAAAEALNWFPIDKLNSYINQLEKELKQAESLMTPEDRKKKAEQDALNARLKTSVGYLEMATQTKLKQWATKGEFEKTEEYQKRLQEESNSQFRSVCNECFPKVSFDVIPIKYDADKETYNFQIKYTLQFEDKSFYHEMSATIPIDVDAARVLSQNTPKIPIIDCVWGEYEHNITPQSYKLIINRDTYTATTKSTDLVIKGADVLPDSPELKTSNYNFSELLRQRIENKEQVLLEIERYNNRMIEQTSISATKIQSSPYYSKLSEYKKKDFLPKYEPKIFTKANDITEIEEYYVMIQTSNEPTIENDPIQPIKEYLKHNYKQGFVDAYFEEHPDSAQFLRKEWLEYKCNSLYQKLSSFVMAYLQNELDPSSRNCREKSWNTYGKYYNTREEFDHDFEKDDDSLRQRKIEYEKLESKISEMQRYFTISAGNQKISDMSLMGANGHSNSYVQNMVQIFNNLSKYPELQEEAAEGIISNNVKAQKEYDKNGHLFATKAEFITAYFSTDYKAILKSKK